MAIANMQAVLKSKIDTVWDVVTNVQDYSWRSDLSKIEVLNDKQFIEYSKDGIVTTFTITLIDEHKRFELDYENENVKGHWVAVFNHKDGQTHLGFIEDAIAKKTLQNLFVKKHLKKQQQRYLNDLKKTLNE